MDIFKKIKKFFHIYFYFFSPREKKRFIIVLAIVAGMALLDIAGIASLLPFLHLVANPQAIQEKPFISHVWQLLGQPGPRRFLFYTGILVFLVLLFNSAFKALGSYILLRFSNSLRYYIGGRLFRGYLDQGYEFFLNRNSNELLNNIVNEVDQIVGMLYLPSMTLISNCILAAAILTALIMFDWFLAIATGIILGGSFWGLYLFARQKVRQLGKERMHSNEMRVKIAGEAFGGIKEIKLKNHEDVFANLFKNETIRFSKSIALSQIYSYLPKFVLEAVAFGGILLIVLYYIISHENIQSILPTIGFIAFAGYKLMPSLQQILNSVTNIRFMFGTMQGLYNDYTLAGKAVQERGAENSVDISFRKKIELRNVSVRYPGSQTDALKKVNIVFHKNQITGIVGKSGAGKTTLVDVILGLLPIREGQLLADNTVIEGEKIRVWQKMLGYVPQNVYLMDNTVAANIAFTLNHDEADMVAVEWAARAAQIHDFIVNELSEGYRTFVGERGIRLSGGQRQRIGIARALYTNPELVVLDEATSALDEPTERAVLKAVAGLRREKTIIMITHRTSTLKVCDKIYRLEKGKVVRGDYAVY